MMLSRLDRAALAAYVLAAHELRASRPRGLRLLEFAARGST
jgi:hypothetical protein